MKPYSEYFVQIDELVGQYELAIANFYHKNIQVPRNIAAAKGFGTGFLVDHPKGVVIVTAAHVAREAIKEKIVYLRIGNNFFPFERQGFLAKDDMDLAVSLLTFEQLENEGIRSLSPIKIASYQKSVIPTGTYAVIGCPASRSEIDQRFKRKKPLIHSMTLEAAKFHNFAGTKIPAPMLLHYDPQKMTMGKNMPPNGKPFDLHGMSGGPIFEIFATPKKINNEEIDIQLSFELAGVAVEWHATHQLVIGTRLKLVQHLIEYL